MIIVIRTWTKPFEHPIPTILESLWLKAMLETAEVGFKVISGVLGLLISQI